MGPRVARVGFTQCYGKAMSPFPHFGLEHMSRQIGRHFADDILKCIFFTENVEIFMKIPPSQISPLSQININNKPVIV